MTTSIQFTSPTVKIGIFNFPISGMEYRRFRYTVKAFGLK